MKAKKCIKVCARRLVLLLKPFVALSLPLSLFKLPIDRGAGFTIGGILRFTVKSLTLKTA